MTKYNWPSREQWAERRQHRYWDCETSCPFADKYSHRLSAYATVEEIAALTTALKDLYRELGRQGRALGSRVKPLQQQRGEGQKAWYQRFKQMSSEDRETFDAAATLQTERSTINDVLEQINNDGIPKRVRHASYVPGLANPLVAPFVARYDAAAQAAEEQWKQECLQTPIDDAAWEEELQQRKQMEDKAADDAAHPERFIHRV